MWKKEFVVQKGAIPNIMCDQLVEQYKQLPAGNATVGSDERVDEKIKDLVYLILVTSHLILPLIMLLMQMVI